MLVAAGRTACLAPAGSREEVGRNATEGEAARSRRAAGVCQDRAIAMTEGGRSHGIREGEPCKEYQGLPGQYDRISYLDILQRLWSSRQFPRAATRPHLGSYRFSHGPMPVQRSMGDPPRLKPPFKPSFYHSAMMLRVEVRTTL
eukprot:222832-Rhodomonas_salina.1